MFEHGPVLEILEQAKSSVAGCAAAPTWSLSEPDLVEFADAMHAVELMARAAKLHAIRDVDGRGLARSRQAPSTRVWLRDRWQLSGGEAGRLIEQARVLDEQPELDAALSSGAINVEQLEAIAASLVRLPRGLDAGLRTEAVSLLAGWAGKLDPRQLRAAGGRILDHVAPEVQEAADKAAADRAERSVHEQRFFTLAEDGAGGARLRGWLDAEAAAVVGAALDPLCAPDAAARETAEGGEPRTPGQRRADALTEVCRNALAAGELPDNGGDRPQMAVTIPYDLLVRGVGVGLLDTGDPISAAAARRLACDARILPVVLGGKGQILDVGRGSRLVTGVQRRVLTVRDRGCVFPGCDRPPRWCDAHHITAWADGGPTDLNNLALLCGFHHRVMHDPRAGWELRLGADDRPEFLPPARIDPERTPRRNTYHHNVLHHRE